MLIDFLIPNNNIYYNIKLAKLIGVYSSIYLIYLLNLSSNNQDEYVKLSRLDIYNSTGIEENKQLEIEQNLIEYKLLEMNKVKNSGSKNYYKLNLELIIKFLTKDDKDIIDDLKIVKHLYNPLTKVPSQFSKRSAIIKALKDAIKTQDCKCRNLLQDWIDGVYQKSGYLSKRGLEHMEEELLKYSNNNNKVFEDLCELAARVVYKDPKWIIVKYEEEHNISSNIIQNQVDQQIINDNINKLKDYKGDVF